MSADRDRWLEALAGRSDAQWTEDPGAREGAAVRDYLQRRAEVEDALPRAPGHERRMLAHLRARGAFTDALEPVVLAPPAPPRPGGFATLAARLTGPLRPGLALGLGGACAAGLALLVVLRNPDAGSRPLPSASPAPVLASREARPAAAAPSVPETPDAEHARKRADAEQELAELKRLRAEAEKKTQELQRLRLALMASPAPAAARSAAAGAARPPAAMAAAADTAGAAAVPKGMPLAAGLQAPAVAGVALDRLFDADTAVLSEAGRKWLQGRVQRHPPGLQGSGAAAYLSIRLATPQGNGSFPLTDLAQQRLRSAAGYLDGLKSAGGGTVKSRILFEGKYGIAIPQVGAEVGRDSPLPDNAPLLWLEFDPAAKSAP